MREILGDCENAEKVMDILEPLVAKDKTLLIVILNEHIVKRCDKILKTIDGNVTVI